MSAVLEHGIHHEFWLCGACLGFRFTLPPHLSLLTTPTGISVAGVSPFRRGCCLFTSSAWRTFATDVESTPHQAGFFLFFWAVCVPVGFRLTNSAAGTMYCYASSDKGLGWITTKPLVDSHFRSLYNSHTESHMHIRNQTSAHVPMHTSKHEPDMFINCE